jgi:hypothetical protein
MIRTRIHSSEDHHPLQMCQIQKTVYLVNTACKLFTMRNFVLPCLLFSAGTVTVPPIIRVQFTCNLLTLEQASLYQSWALAHLFEVRYPLLTQFFPMDR